MGCVHIDADGIVVTVRLSPKADRDALAGIEALADGREALKARVRALPSEGEANDALVRLFAKSLGVPKSAVALVSGHKQRLKQVRVEGDAAALAARLSELVRE